MTAIEHATRSIVIYLLLTLCLFCPCAADEINAAQPSDILPSSVRTPRLAEWESLKYGMFICYNINTFMGQEHATEKPPADLYAPTDLDVGQWIRVAKQAGMKYAVLVAKHDPGFCLWDSENYDNDVGAATEKTDVVAEFMAACKKEGIKPGIYYCILDADNEGGLKWGAKIKDDYYDLIKRHLTELHTNYPGIYELWLDIPYKLSPTQRRGLYQLSKNLAPDCLVLMQSCMNNTCRDGSEILLGSWPTDLLNSECAFPPAEGHNPTKKYKGISDRGEYPADEPVNRECLGKEFYLPMEVCNTIGDMNWFWKEGYSPKSLWRLYALYKISTERGANLLLGVAPDKTGKLPDNQVKALLELKKVIDNPQLAPPGSLTLTRFAKASGTWENNKIFGPQSAFDDSEWTFWRPRNGQEQAWIEVDLDRPTTFNKAVIWGSGVKSFELQTKENGTWRDFHKGNAVDGKIAFTFPPVIGRLVRLKITPSQDNARIIEFQLFDTTAK